MNKLTTETSPYLLQHAENPVEWYPWGDEALALAKKLNKPILLSIGYSACHWCHVMAHESFEDEKAAALMNEHFINIKVDREERPDLDKIYQTAHYMLTQRSGGWPLTMFLMPDDQMPFFGGTYFPNKPRHGMISFQALLNRVSDLFNNRKDDIQKQSDSLADALKNTNSPQGSQSALSSAPLDQARVDLQREFDVEKGGFGIAPKFPHTPYLERLMRHGFNHDQVDEKAVAIASFTLKKMALGGVNDLLGGGFCRYSTDDVWMIPHFEKMLYDNGSLLAEYAQAGAAIDEPLFEKVSHETAQWVMREMQSSAEQGEGGYYSSYDADSVDENGKSHEGLFYVWTPDEVKQILTEQEYPVFARHFGLDQKPNFEGKWHLHVYQPLEALADEFGQAEETLMALINSARVKLLTVRNKRTWPGRDEKILTSWNALMIRGMAMTARYYSDSENASAYEKSAIEALDFIRTTLWKEGRLLATYKSVGNNKTAGGKAHLMAYLDDYAFLLDALLELLQLRWRNQDLRFAQAIADTLLDQFEDKDKGGFWFVAHDHENLIQRPKSYTDDATPNGNGVAVFALQRLGYLLGETRYLDAAERALKNASKGMDQIPTAHCTMLKALDEYLNAPQTVIVRAEEVELTTLKLRFNKRYQPRRQCYFIANNEVDLHPALEAKEAVGEALAYICEGMTCMPPTEDFLELF